MNKPFIDTFSDDRPSGKTIGTQTQDGTIRRGTDREGAIAIDNLALRFKPLIKPGWGRQGIAYGEYRRASGLAMAVLVLNGHNTSQAETIEWLYKRIPQWLRGSETESIPKRVVAWLGSQHKQDIVRRILGWLRVAAEITKFFPLPQLNDNLAVGWFADVVPQDPQRGNSFIVRATGAENGELLATVGTNVLSVFRGLQNVPVYYIVILRERGAAYYAASLPQVRGLPNYPQLRPVAIDAVNETEVLYAGIHQSVLGQIGFRANTRVYGVKVETIDRLANWYGTAQVADSLRGEAELTASSPEVGSNWQVIAGNWQRTAEGSIANEPNSMAVIDPQVASGLLHLCIATGSVPAEVGIIWRWQDEHNYWCCSLDRQQCKVRLVENGRVRDTLVADTYLLPNNTAYLQIIDDGSEIGIYLDGIALGDRIYDKCLATATGVGLILSPNDTYLQNFEAHPRTVTIPELDLGLFWWQSGNKTIVRDNFTSDGELTGKTTSIGDRVWQKTIGTGTFKIQSGIAWVQASVENPNPGRTAYTIAWDRPSADIAVKIFPPGKGGQGEKGRSGLIFWQDEDNYIIVNTWLDDFYDGESISCFFRLAGFEEIYDAVWSNIGKAIAFGEPYTLRVVFDGDRYTVRVNQQTVLYRALTDVYPWVDALKINRLGIVANWEWGNDTGSGFSDFTVRAVE